MSSDPPPSTATPSAAPSPQPVVQASASAAVADAGPPEEPWDPVLYGPPRIVMSALRVCLVEGGFARCEKSREPRAIFKAANDARSLSLADLGACVVDRKGNLVCDEEMKAPALSGLAEVSVSAGYGCARGDDGGVHCWKAGGAAVRVFEGAKAIAVQKERACAVTREGKVSCWASGGAPKAVPAISRAKQIAVGDGHACALIEDGTVRCWGANDTAQLADATLAEHPLAVVVNGVSKVVAIAAGDRHACALTERGFIACWGANDKGQLAKTPGAPAGITLVKGVEHAVAIAASGGRTCTRSEDQQIKCWGEGGDSSATEKSNALVPTEIPSLAGARSVIALPGRTVCAIMGKGTLACDPREALDARVAQVPDVVKFTGNCALSKNGGLTCRSAPQESPIMARDIAAANIGGCFLSTRGGVSCWGQQWEPTSREQLRTGAGFDWTLFTLDGIEGATKIAAGGRYRVVALMKDGTLRGQELRVGTPPSPTAVFLPVKPIEGFRDVVDLVDGSKAPCARFADGTARCIGEPTPELKEVAQITGKHDHACVRRKDGAVLCWGGNGSGQLGDGTTTSRTEPTPVAGLAKARDVSATPWSTCAVTEEGKVYCWGSGFGPLVDSAERWAPVVVWL